MAAPDQKTTTAYGLPVVNVATLSHSGVFSSSPPSSGNATDEPAADYDDYSDNHILVTLTIIYSFVFIFGLTGNGLVIYSIKRCRKLHNVTCVLLANLAAADLILIICVLPFKLIASFINAWVFGAAVCRLLPYLSVLSPACSVFTMVAISLERYYAVIYPLRAKSVLTLGRAKKVVILLWIVSILYSIPALWSKVFTRQRFDGYDGTVANCNDGWAAPIIEQLYALYLFTFIFAVPLFIVTVCYAQVILTLQRNRHPSDMSYSGRDNTRVASTKSLSDISASQVQAHTTHVSNHGKVLEEMSRLPASKSTRIVLDTGRRRTARRDEKRKVVLMLLLVVVLFVCLWGPVLLYNVLLRFGLGSQNYWTTWRLSMTFHLMAYFNSCINPVVYFFVSKNFRDSFLTVMCCRPEDSKQRQFGVTWKQPTEGESKLAKSTSSSRIATSNK